MDYADELADCKGPAVAASAEAVLVAAHLKADDCDVITECLLKAHIGAKVCQVMQGCHSVSVTLCGQWPYAAATWKSFIGY